MISQFYKEMTGKESVIRKFFDYSRQRAAELGPDSVYNFSIGNPSVPVPQKFTDAMTELLEKEDPVKLHGYSPTLGQPTTKDCIADSLNRRFGMNYTGAHIFPTSGAAGALSHALRCVAGPNDTVLTFAPYFPEYIPYVTGTGASLKVVPADTSSFQINFEKFEEMLTPSVAAVLINSPNNPSGIVYTTETIKRLAAVLTAKQEEFHIFPGRTPLKIFKVDIVSAIIIDELGTYQSAAVVFNSMKERIVDRCIDDYCIAWISQHLDGKIKARYYTGRITDPFLIDSESMLGFFPFNKSLIVAGRNCVIPEDTCFEVIRDRSGDRFVDLEIHICYPQWKEICCTEGLGKTIPLTAGSTFSFYIFKHFARSCSFHGIRTGKDFRLMRTSSGPGLME